MLHVVLQQICARLPWCSVWKCVIYEPTESNQELYTTLRLEFAVAAPVIATLINSMSIRIQVWDLLLCKLHFWEDDGWLLRFKSLYQKNGKFIRGLVSQLLYYYFFLRRSGEIRTTRRKRVVEVSLKSIYTSLLRNLTRWDFKRATSSHELQVVARRGSGSLLRLV